MGKYEINVTNDVAEKLIEKLIVELQYKNYGEYRDGEVPFFVSTFQWLNPNLKDVVTDTASAAKFLAGVFSCAGMNKEEVIKAATNFYNFYNDSDLIPDYRDEDRY